MKEKECSQMVAGEGKWGSFHQSRCMKKPTKYEDDKWWCTIHSPSYKAEKQAKDKEAFEAKMAGEREGYKRKAAIGKLTEGISTEFIEQHPNILRDIQGE